MNRRIALSTLLALIALVVLAVPALAMKPLAVHIEADEIIPSGTADPFVATGPAVGAGLVCGSGVVEDIDFRISGSPGGPFSILHITKHFTCDGGTGTFDVDMVVKLDNNTGDTTANWKVVGGTGAYASLKGNGKLVGIPSVPGSILDIYDGKLR